MPHARNHKKVIPANVPLPDPLPTQKTLVEQKSDFTAEGAPPPDPGARGGGTAEPTDKRKAP